MANVEHSALTGSNLHEPKGVATATADTVYIADGLGSGAWATVGLTSLSAAAQAFQGALLHVRDQKASGTAGGTFTAGSWVTRTLNNTVTNGISGASVATNQITLPSGSYFVIARAPALAVIRHQAKIRNVTGGFDSIYGTTEYTEVAAQTTSWCMGQFASFGTQVFELQHRCSSTNTDDGLGGSASSGIDEVFSEVLIWKLT